MAERQQSTYALTPVATAQETIRREVRVLEKEKVPLGEALGRVLACSVLALDALPPFPASIKDGYAVVASDGLGTFPVIGEARAGAAATELAPGTAVYITTGAPVPKGADAVIQVEDTERVKGSREVTILKAAKRGQDIRTVGSDIEKGQECLPKGTLLGPAEIGILATVGAHTVDVYRQPVVAVMSTGDEVVEPSTTKLGPGQIRDSNRSMLLGAVRAAGAQAVDLGIVRDQEGDLQGCFDRAVADGADVIITSGGVSMGDRDLVKPLLERSGSVHFGRVLMKPGKPLTFATMDLAEHRRVLFFGLPGNPVSSIVCFHLFVASALKMIGNHPCPELSRVMVKLQADLKLDPDRPEYHRVIIAWDGSQGANHFVAGSTGGQRSSRLLSVRSTTGLLELPQGPGIAQAGSFVSCILIGDLRDALGR